MALTRTAALRSVISGLGLSALLIIGLHVASIALMANQGIRPGFGIPLYALILINGTLQAAFALLVVWRVRDLGPLLGALYFAAIDVGQLYPRNDLSTEGWPDRLLFALIAAVAMGAAVRFAQNFPKPVRESDLRGLRLAALLRLLLKPAVVWPLMFAGTLVNHVILWLPVGHALMNVLVATTALTFVRLGYQQSGEAEQRKIYWIMQGILVMLVAMVVSLVVTAMGWPVWNSAVIVLGQLTMLLCASFAVFYQGAIDPRLVVKRTAALSIAAGVVVALFVLLETAVTNMLVGRLASDSSAVQIGAGAIATLFARPVHKQVERVLQRKLPQLGND